MEHTVKITEYGFPKEVFFLCRLGFPFTAFSCQETEVEITLKSPTSWVESESCLFLLRSMPCVREYNSKINFKLI